MRNRKKTKARLLSMDELQARPCEVDGVPALFHRWVEGSRVINLDVIAFKMDVLHNTYALVEYRDGTVGKVEPERVRFVREE